jgi:hypothetical protein
MKLHHAIRALYEIPLSPTAKTSISNDEDRFTIDDLWMSLSHRGVGFVPYGPEAEAQALQPLQARFQPAGLMGLQAGFRLIEPKARREGRLRSAL